MQTHSPRLQSFVLKSLVFEFNLLHLGPASFLFTNSVLLKRFTNDMAKRASKEM